MYGTLSPSCVPTTLYRRCLCLRISILYSIACNLSLSRITAVPPKDMKATGLTTKLAQPIREKAGEMADGLVQEFKGDPEIFGMVNKHFQDLLILEDNNAMFRTELGNITSQHSRALQRYPHDSTAFVIWSQCHLGIRGHVRNCIILCGNVEKLG